MAKITFKKHNGHGWYFTHRIDEYYSRPKNWLGLADINGVEDVQHREKGTTIVSATKSFTTREDLLKWAKEIVDKVEKIIQDRKIFWELFHEGEEVEI